MEEQDTMQVYFYFTAFVISFSVFMEGFDIPLLNRPEKYVDRLYNQTYSRNNHFLTFNQDVHWGYVAACRNVGGLIGASIGSSVAQKLGRKYTLILNTVFSFSAGVFGIISLSEYFPSTDLLAFARLFSGIHMGITISVVPVYLLEISPIAIRGAMGSLPELTLNFGLIFNMVLYLPGILDKYHQWSYIYGGYIFISLIKALLLLFIPESPKHLLLNQRNERECRRVVFKLWGEENLETAMMEMKKDASTMAFHVTYKDLFSFPHFWKLLLIACVLQLVQIFCGIVPINYFSNVIFTKAGFSEETSSYITLGIHLVFILGTFLSMKYVDHYGRRVVLLLGLAGVIISHGILTLGLVYGGTVISHGNTSWADILAIFACVVFMLFSAIGPVPVPWYMTGELFPTQFVPKAVSVAMIVNRTANIIQTFMFPITNEICKDYTFLIYLGLCLLFWLFVYFVVPETKNRTFEKVYRQVSGEDFFGLGSSKEFTLYEFAGELVYKETTL